MTDPTPNNLPGPEPLSPAQAIVKAFDDCYELLGPLEDDWQEQCIAAALGALADQMPITFPMSISDLPEDVCRWLKLGYARCDNTNRRWLRAIATELEGQP
jgi:hypothetical protein